MEEEPEGAVTEAEVVEMEATEEVLQAEAVVGMIKVAVQQDEKTSDHNSALMIPVSAQVESPKGV